MKTSEIYTENEVLMFHISLSNWLEARRRSGHGILEFVGPKKIYEYSDWDDMFILDFEENGEELSREEQGLFDNVGNQIMDYNELNTAQTTGIGILNIDGDYNTTYTTYLKNITEDEFLKLDEKWKKIYLIIVNGLDEDKLEYIPEDYLKKMYLTNNEYFIENYEDFI